MTAFKEDFSFSECPQLAEAETVTDDGRAVIARRRTSAQIRPIAA